MANNRKQNVPAIFNRIAGEMFDPQRVLSAIDSRKLRATAAGQPDYVSPRTAVEEVLAGIWSESLRVERVGINDNFFGLGGHSLLATQVVSRIRNVLDVEVPLNALFKSPTVAGLAEAVERERGAGWRVESPPIAQAGRDRDLPLSFAQQRMWFIQQLEPEGAAYNIPLVVRLRGGLGIAGLRQSLQEIARRHEMLRTRFESREGRLVQVIDEPCEIEFPIWDVSELAVDDREQRARELVGQEAKRPFDLERGPVWRSALVRVGADNHLLLVCMHHVASDGWSTGVIVKEFASLYESYREGLRSQLAELEVQYADFALWQREWLQGEVLEEQLEYWRRQLSGVTVLELPTDRPRPTVPSQRGASLAFRLPAELTQALKQLSRREGVTIFMTLLAAFQALLARYSGRDEILVGAPISGRNRAEIEGLIGFFVNTLVMRTQVAGDLSIRELLGRVRETTLGAYAHQDLPFEKLVEQLQPERSLSREPLFQVMLVFQNAPRGAGGLSGLRIAPEPPAVATAKFDLTLSLTEVGDELHGSLEYATDLYESHRIIRLLSHLRRVLEAMRDDGDQRLKEIGLMTPSERQQVLVEWNATQVVYTTERCLPELFEQQAARCPEAVAVVFEEQQLSYDELNRQANRLGHYLRSLGVGPESRVGLYLERSLEMVIGLLGVLKAGGAYVPLDPGYPSERLAFMLADAQATIVLTQPHLAEKITDNQAQVISLTQGGQRIENEPAAEATYEGEVSSGVSSENLAYIIYTSGSTGRPKGIGLPQRALTNLIEWHRETMLGGVKVLQFASLSFDASFHEIFAAWVTGGTIVLIPEEMRFDVSALMAHIREQGIEKVILPVVVLQRMAELEGPENHALQVVKEITTTGEQLQITRPVVELFSQLRGWQLHNHYGPSESHVVTAYQLSGEPASWSRHPSIGKPVANTQIYLLDGEQEPVALGVSGELYIGGVSLAQGYWGRPELTAEKFVPDPLGASPGGRLYRTGDLCRYDVSGELAYEGRIDHQVKVRGYRIEPGEIEAVLEQFGEVRQCVVMVREDEPGDKRLVAYVVANGEGAATVAELRDYLRGRLPDYMVPSAFVSLEQLPVTPNGKIDRKALPAPSAAAATMESEEPRTPVEEIVAGIWCEVLRLERVGVEENFFELGGHSLVVTQVVSRIREALGVEVALRALFETPTVAGLAETVERERGTGKGVNAPPIVTVSRDRELPLSYAQQRLWFMQQLEPDSSIYNVPMAVRLEGILDVAALRQSLAEIARRHEVLRTRFIAISGRPWQVIDEPGECELLVWNLGGLSEGDGEAWARDIVTEELGRHFDLERGPVWRAALLHLSAQDHLLVVSMHHVASDGWSTGLLVSEFASLYENYRQGDRSRLSELEVQYADFAVWQREWLSGDVLEKQMGYWRRQLAGAPVLELPTDKPRPAVATHQGASVAFSLSTELSQQLNSLSRREGVTLFMTLLAAFQVVLSRYAEQEDIVVGTDVANRNRLETEGLIGFFVNQLVLRTDLSGNPSFRELLRRVRETTLGAYGHQDVPFERIVQELTHGRNLGHSPLFQVKLVLQTAAQAEAQVAGVGFSGVRVDAGVAKFDLTLTLGESKECVYGTVGYTTDLFERASIDRLLKDLQMILEQVVANSEHRLTDLLLAEDKNLGALKELELQTFKVARRKALNPAL